MVIQEFTSAGRLIKNFETFRKTVIGGWKNYVMFRYNHFERLAFLIRNQLNILFTNKFEHAGETQEEKDGPRK